MWLFASHRQLTQHCEPSGVRRALRAGVVAGLGGPGKPRASPRAPRATGPGEASSCASFTSVRWVRSDIDTHAFQCFSAISEGQNEMAIRRDDPGRRDINKSVAMLKVLIVEDQPAVVTALQVLFEIRGMACAVARSPEEALRRLDADGARAEPEIGVVLQDMNFSPEATSGEEGVALFREIKQRDPELPVLLLTAWTLARDRGPARQGGRERLPRQALGRRQAPRLGAQPPAPARAAARERPPARPGAAELGGPRRAPRPLRRGLGERGDARRGHPRPAGGPRRRARC